MVSKLRPHFRTAMFVSAASILVACGGGGGGTTTTATPPATPPPPTAGDVTISGAITFEEVGVETEEFSLDLADLTTLPARGIVVEAVTGAGVVLDTTTTSDTGAYSVTVAPNTAVIIQARAELNQTAADGATWNVVVEDNTNDDAQYVLAGSLTNSGTTNSVRNLFAPSGSNGVSAYTGPRVAGPFFMLDEILNGLQLVESVDPNVVIPPFRILWSVNNRIINDDEESDISEGDLTSSFFSTNVGGIPSIVILGDLDTDTDEYDEHVVTHEFGHFLTFGIFRDDSVGGAHSLASLLDPRVAFSEGFGNAIAAMITNDPLYIDAGFGPDGGFAFNVELNTIGNIILDQLGIPAGGWYGESSVQSIIYDIFDTNNDGVDGLALGFGPIYETFQTTEYLNSDSATSIFSYLQAMLDNGVVTQAQLDPLLGFQNINGTGEFGLGETNDGGVPVSLPVFHNYTVGDPPIIICSIDDAGEVNNIGNRALISLTVPQAGSFSVVMALAPGEIQGGVTTERDPDYFIFNGDDFVTSGTSSAENIESQQRTLPAGVLWIDAHDFNNISLNEDVVPGDACYSFSVN